MKLDYLCIDLDMVDDEEAMKVFRSIRWANGVYCPKCKSFDTIMAGGGKGGNPNKYICKICNSNFNDLSGTIFQGSHFSLGEIFYILFHLNRKSIKQISEELSYSRQSIHRISKIFNEDINEQAKRKRNL